MKSGTRGGVTGVDLGEAGGRGRNEILYPISVAFPRRQDLVQFPQGNCRIHPLRDRHGPFRVLSPLSLGFLEITSSQY